MSLARPAILLSGVALCVCFSVRAAEAPSQQNTDPAVDQTESTASNDVSVGIDPKTKKLRPLTAAETKVLSDKAASMARRPGSQWENAPKTAAEARTTLRNHPGGAASMRVPTDAMSQLTVERDADGRLHFSEGETTAKAKQEVIK